MTAANRNPDGHLITIYLDGNPVRYTLDGPVVTLGRGVENQIQVPHPAVSACHLVFTQSASGSYQMTDVGSSNGTAVNGSETNQCQLRDGDCIVIGKMVSAQYALVSQHRGIAGDLDSLALVKGRAPTFESLCQRGASLEEDQLILPS